VEVIFGGDPALATRKPTAFFVARADGATALTELLIKRVPATPSPSTFVHSLGDSTPKDVSAFWMAAHELSNRQFASILQLAFSQGLVQVASDPRRVTYQGQVVCLLATHKKTATGNLGYDEVDFNERAGFFVATPVANHPARGVTWHGAYLTTVVMNLFGGYSGKSVPATWSYADGPEGYHLPSDAQWEWTGRSGVANRLYPTGATINTAWANYGPVANKTTPVTSYPANVFGILNLAGNVSEWVFQTVDGAPDNAYTRGGHLAGSSAESSKSATGEAVQCVPRFLSQNDVNLPYRVRLALKDDRSPTVITRYFPSRQH